jgi:hypothetical protein
MIPASAEELPDRGEPTAPVDPTAKGLLKL